MKTFWGCGARKPRRDVVYMLLLVPLLLVGACQVERPLIPNLPTESSTAATGSNSTPIPPEADRPPLLDVPPGFKQTKCFYDVPGSATREELPGEAHQMMPEGRIEQAFTSSEAFIWWVSVIIGYDPATPPGPVRLALLDEDKRVLAEQDIPIANNIGTVYRFTPVPVTPGRIYWTRVTNTTGMTVGIYMHYVPTKSGEHSKPPGTGTTLAYGEVQRDDGERQDSLAGCVAGARPT